MLVLIAVSTVLILTAEVGGRSSVKNSDVCGISTVIMPRIAGSIAAQDDDFPWLIRLIVDGDYTWSSLPLNGCSATIISDEWLLTAAHCVHDLKSEPKRLIGTSLMSLIPENNDESGLLRIKAIFEHPSYSASAVSNIDAFTNDYALLQLAVPLNFTAPDGQAYTPICLLDDCNSEVDVTSICLTAGWGSDRMRYGPTNQTVDDSLRKIVYPLDPPSTCQQMFDTRFGSGSVTLNENTACFGFKDDAYFDGCQGDSGASMVCRNWPTRRYYLHGIDSFAAGCSNPLGNYRVYYRPCTVMGWIKDVTGRNDYGIPPPTPRATFSPVTDKPRRHTFPPTSSPSPSPSPNRQPLCGERHSSWEYSVDPWLAVVAYGPPDSANKKLTKRCGATILSKRWLITFKSCLNYYKELDLTDLRVFVAGNFDDRKDLDYDFGLPLDIQADHETLDLTLLKLNKDIDFETTGIRPICLPKSDNIVRNCSISGWDTFQAASDCSTSHSQNVRLLNRKKGSGSLTQLTLTKPLYNCDDDVGGPVACSYYGQPYVLLGVVAPSSRSNTGTLLMAPVFGARDWIRTITNELNDDADDNGPFIPAHPNYS